MKQVAFVIFCMILAVGTAVGVTYYVHTYPDSLSARTSSPWKKNADQLEHTGTIKVYPTGTATSTCNAANAGSIMYATGTAGFYGCNGISWELLTN